MSKTVYMENGISVQDDGVILLIRCPKCGRENWAMAVRDGECCWCGYNAHNDAELKERIETSNKK